MKNEKEKVIRDMIKSSRNRAYRESFACILVIGFFSYNLKNLTFGSSAYVGSILIIASAGFISGVVWCFAWTVDMLKNHPVSESNFWYSAFSKQVSLLRSVPLWYVTPLFVGMMLMQLPEDSSNLKSFLTSFIFYIGLGVFLVWLNRKAASSLEEKIKLFTQKTIG